jgi:hypothetical protein
MLDKKKIKLSVLRDINRKTGNQLYIYNVLELGEYGHRSMIGIL